VTTVLLASLIAMLVVMPDISIADADSVSIDIELPLIQGTESRWIARRTSLNGVPASLRSLRHAASLDEVVEHYRRVWRSEGDMRVEQQPDRTVLSMRLPDHFVSLQLVSSMVGTDGVLVISADPGRYLGRHIPDLPLPSGLVLLAQQTHLDGARRAETLTFVSRDGVSLVRKSLIGALGADGWLTLRDAPAATMQSGHTLLFGRENERLNAIIGRDSRWGESTLVLMARQPRG